MPTDKEILSAVAQFKQIANRPAFGIKDEESLEDLRIKLAKLGKVFDEARAEAQQDMYAAQEKVDRLNNLRWWQGWWR